MASATLHAHSPKRLTLHSRIDEIQAAWSLSQRSQRYQDVQKRMLDFVSILAPHQIEPKILAIGAPTVEDCSRLASGR